jgi:hypothetical protein
METNLENCPWQGFQPATIKFCEEELCSWITQPANTWSNIGFVIAGIIIYRQAKTLNQSGLKLIAISSVLVGFGSGMFHASSTFLFELFDLLGMFMISGILLCFNLQRLTGISNRLNTAIYIVLNAASVGLMLIWNESGIATFAIQIAIALTFEILLHIRRDEVNYRHFIHMTLAFAFSFGFWGLDISKTWCDPKNHIITGHAVWHILNAFAIYFIFKFYTQFSSTKKGRFTLEPRR